MGSEASVLLVVGGGRWGQVTLSVLARMQVPFDRVVVISKVNSDEVQLKIDEIKAISSVALENIATLDEALSKYIIGAAIVVNASALHFQTASRLIKQGIHVLIEKPITQSLQQMQELIDSAKQNRACIVPGLSYRFCSYLKNFSNEVKSRGEPSKFSIRWVDAINEIRYGQVKTHDASINVVQDVMPHIWTILSVVFKSEFIQVDQCWVDDKTGSQAVIYAKVGGIRGEITLDRSGSSRQRDLSVQFDKGSLFLDFSTEPGVVYAEKGAFSGDADWDKTPTPLARQIEHFFAMILTGRSAEEDLQCCVESVACVERATTLGVFKTTSILRAT